MRVAKIRVDRSEHHSVSMLVGSWEILILQFEFGPEKVVIEGFKKIVGKGYPDAEQEFLRLSQRYGIDTDAGAPKAALTYGQGAMGVMNLRQLIEAEKKLEATEELEAVNMTLNVVPNEVAAELIAANPIPSEAKEADENTSALVKLLTEALAQNKALAEQLAKMQAPTPAEVVSSKPTLGLPKAKDAA